MNLLKKVAGINLAILLIYSVAIRLLNSGGGNGKAMGILIFSAIAIGLHVFICLIITAVEYGNKDKERGKAWFLSSGIVLLIGFSTCLGNASF